MRPVALERDELQKIGGELQTASNRNIVSMQSLRHPEFWKEWHETPFEPELFKSIAALADQRPAVQREIAELDRMCVAQWNFGRTGLR